MSFSAPPSAALDGHHSIRLGGAARRETIAASLFALTKPRLSLLSVLTTVLGYFAARPAVDLLPFVALVAGTALSAGGALALNQWMERNTDCLMERTRDRPLATGQIGATTGLVFGLALAVAGVGLLLVATPWLAAALSAATIISYLLIYTPLKLRTRWAMELGAVSGALPPLIGWAAAEGRISALGWVLFGILFFWQLPHFLAIGWTYRREYGAAGFPMLPVADHGGSSTGGWAVGYTAALLVVSILPFFLGLDGGLYLAAAVALGAVFLVAAVRFLLGPERDAAARRLFHFSLLYLPLLLGALVVDRLLF